MCAKLTLKICLFREGKKICATFKNLATRSSFAVWLTALKGKSISHGPGLKPHGMKHWAEILGGNFLVGSRRGCKIAMVATALIWNRAKQQVNFFFYIRESSLFHLHEVHGAATETESGREMCIWDSPLDTLLLFPASRLGLKITSSASPPREELAHGFGSDRLDRQQTRHATLASRCTPLWQPHTNPAFWKADCKKKDKEFKCWCFICSH